MNLLAALAQTKAKRIRRHKKFVVKTLLGANRTRSNPKGRRGVDEFH